MLTILLSSRKSEILDLLRIIRFSQFAQLLLNFLTDLLQLHPSKYSRSSIKYLH